MSEVAARARVRGRDELHLGRETRPLARALQPDLALLQRLPQALEHRPCELRELVEEQHAAVRARDLAGSQRRAAAEQRLRRRADVRRAQRGTPRQSPHRAEQRLDLRELERPPRIQVLEQQREATRQHALAGARWALHPERVPTERRERERFARLSLSAHVVEAQRLLGGDALRLARLRARDAGVGIRLGEARGDLREVPASVHGDAGRETGFAGGFGRSDHAQRTAALRGARRG
jgi:hypothetical protein